MNYFIHTNKKQALPALISKFNSEHNFNSDKINLLTLEEFPGLTKYFGNSYLRNGIVTIWAKNDLQSFTLLRFLVPELSNFEGFSIVTDPDVFLMKNYSSVKSMVKNIDADIFCRKVTKENKTYDESSIMIFRNESFKNFDFNETIKNLFEKKIDYKELIHLNYFKKTGLRIHNFDENFNSFDKFTSETIFLHTTGRQTQPWKEGLDIDFSFHVQDKTTNPAKGILVKVKIYLQKIKRVIRSKIFPIKYIRHPNIEVISFFDELFLQAYQSNIIDKEMILDAIAKKYISKKYKKFL